MPQNHTPASILAEWQTEIAQKLEAGQTPVLDLGMGDGGLDTLPGLAALQALAAARTDLSAPAVIVGGNAALWLAALLQERGAAPPGSPDIATLYAGADRTTYMATLTTQSTLDGSGRKTALLRPPAQLPTNLAWCFAPSSSPGAADPWESLPFALADRPTAAPMQTDRATAYAALILAAGLLILALLL